MDKRPLLLLLCCCIGLAWGQEKNFVDTATRIVSYDFRTGEYTTPLKRVKVHTPVVFEIKNINPFAYKVTLTPKDSILAASSFDKELLQIIAKWDIQEAEVKLTSSQNDLNRNVANQASLTTVADFKDHKKGDTTIITAEENKQAFNITNEILELNKKIRRDSASMDSINTLLVSNPIVVSTTKELGIDTIDTKNLPKLKLKVKTKLDSLKDSTITDSLQKQFANEDRLEDIAMRLEEQEKFQKSIMAYTERKSQLRQLEGKMNESMKSYQVLANDFFAKYDVFMVDVRHLFNMLRYAKAINTIADNPQLDYPLFKVQYESAVKNYARDIFESVSSVEHYKRSYSELTNAYFKLIYSPLLDDFMSPSGISKIQAYPQFLKMKSDQLADWLAKHPVDNILRQAQWVASVLQDPSRYSIRSIPIQPENDLFEFHVHIKKRGGGISDAHYSERDFIYRQPTYGGTRVDFSLGLAASHYSNVATYELNDTLAIVKSKENSITVPSLVGMVTMSLRKTGYVAYGGSAGMGIGVENGKIQLSNFYAGLTMLLGKRERIFISLGPSLRNVKQLSASTREGTVVPNAVDLSSYMKDLYKVGVFASITYSLTKDAKSMIRNIW